MNPKLRGLLIALRSMAMRPAFVLGCILLEASAIIIAIAFYGDLLAYAFSVLACIFLIADVKLLRGLLQRSR